MLSQSIIPELQQETLQTKKMLEKVPYQKADWKPHEKSMNLWRLSTHISEIPSWITTTINTEEMDLGTWKYNPPQLKSTEELLQNLDKNTEEAIKTLRTASDEHLMVNWTLRSGEHIILKMPRIAVIRSVGMNHLIHHRAQLSVFLRLLDVPVPGMYGPSADDN
jgi:uncharacterized damage-inducible protein DinB